MLPLVPGYISLISGAGLEELQHRDGRLRWALALNSILFILGFSAVFLALGAAATTVGQLIRQQIGVLTRVAGAVIIGFTPQSFYIDAEGKITKTTIGLTAKKDLEDGAQALLSSTNR